MPEKPIFHDMLLVRKPISHDLFAAATFVWRAQRTVTIENLTQAARFLKTKASKQEIEDMVKVSEFLNTVCP